MQQNEIVTLPLFLSLLKSSRETQNPDSSLAIWLVNDLWRSVTLLYLSKIEFAIELIEVESRLSLSIVTSTSSVVISPVANREPRREKEPVPILEAVCGNG